MTVIPPTDPTALDSEPVSLLPPASGGLIWTDLAALSDAPAKVPGVCGILYPGSVGAFIGDAGAGKSFLAAGVIAAHVASGGSAVVVDAEDVAPTLATRLRALGMDPASLGEVMYLRAAAAPSDGDIRWLAALVEQVPGTVVVLDSVAELMALGGLDEDLAGDVTRWFQTVPRPLAHGGASVLLLDHRAKASATRGRWARGSGAKLAAIDGAALVLEPVEPFSRESSGSADLIVAKDRPGAIGAVGQTAAVVRFDVAGGSLHAVRIIRTPGVSHGAASDGPTIVPRPASAGAF